jgi:CRISPR system Cascade subunit CasB
MSEPETSSRTTQFLTDDLIGQFVARLGRLDAAGRARLKRNVGHTLDEARDVHQIFFAILPFEIHGRVAEENCFLIATLFPIGTRRDRDPPANPPHNFGASLNMVRQELLRREPKREPDRPISLDQRVAALLNTDREQLPFRLRQMVSLLAAHKIAINWRQLLRDVQRWEVEPRRVQRHWADAYFRGTTAKTDNNVPSNNTDKTTSTEEAEP